MKKVIFHLSYSKQKADYSAGFQDLGRVSILLSFKWHFEVILVPSSYSGVKRTKSGRGPALNTGNAASADKSLNSILPTVFNGS